MFVWLVVACFSRLWRTGAAGLQSPLRGGSRRAYLNLTFLRSQSFPVQIIVYVPVHFGSNFDLASCIDPA